MSEADEAAESVQSIVMWISPGWPSVASAEKPNGDKSAYRVVKQAPLRRAWAEYKASLMDKYPAPDGEPWEFTCPHHRRIDEMLST